MVNTNRFVWLVALFLGVYAINALAVYWAGPNARWADIFYGALQLFAISLPAHLQASGQNVTGLLNWTRFLAPLVTVAALVFGFASTVREYAEAFLARRLGRPNIVIIGFGRVGRALLESLHSDFDKPRIVCIDRKVTVADQNLVRKYGGLLYEADAFDQDALRSYLVGLDYSPDHSHKVFVACGSDEQTLAVISDLEFSRVSRGTGRNLKCVNQTFYHLQSHRFAEKLRNLPAIRSEPFELALSSVQEMMDRFCLPLLARASFQSQVHVVIHGSGSHTMLALEEVLLTGIMPAPTYALPRVTVICKESAIAKARWEAKHAGAWQHFNVVFEDLPSGGIPGADADESPYRKVEDELPITLHLVALDDDSEVLAYALSLREMMRRGLRQTAPIATFAGAATASISGLAQSSRVAQLRFEVGGDSVIAAKRSFFCTRELERLAQDIHEGFLEVVSQTPGAKDWGQYRNLAYTFKLSNRRAATHMLTKLRLLGIEDLNPYAPGFHISGEARRYVKKVLADPDAMARIETFEHMRWRFDRLLEGWRDGSRSEDAMTREQLGDVDVSRMKHEKVEASRNARLSRDETKKDMAQVASLTRYLARNAVPHPNRKPARRVVTRSWTRDPPAWVVENRVPRLVLEHAPKDWRAWSGCGPDADLRVQILVPPPPDLLLQPVPIGEEGISREEADRRLTQAYCGFAEELARQGIKIRLVRGRGMVWNWLPSEAICSRLGAHIEGVTLPRLVIGVAGHRDVAQLGDPAHVEARLTALFCGICGDGPAKLVVGGAPGIDAIALRAFAVASEGRPQFTAHLLYPYEADGKPAWDISPDALISDEQLVRFQETTFIGAAVGQEEDRHVVLANTLLDRVNYLVAVSDGVSKGPGGTADIIDRAKDRHMLMRCFEAPM